MSFFALNHMTVARHSFLDLVALAQSLGCMGIEARNDLPRPLFDGMDPSAAGDLVRAAGLRLLAVAEVKRFNDWSKDKAAEALSLMRIARAAGAEGVSLIPRNDNGETADGARQPALRSALKALKPMLEDHGLFGLVEPLGFETCALRSKSEAVEAIEDVGGAGRFKLVHDSFHHTIAHEGPFFPEHTGIVHISGVVDPSIDLAQMRDAHRVLVTAEDRLDNIGQIAALRAAGWDGPCSFEAFAPEVHELSDPAHALHASMSLITRGRS